MFFHRLRQSGRVNELSISEYGIDFLNGHTLSVFITEQRLNICQLDVLLCFIVFSDTNFAFRLLCRFEPWCASPHIFQTDCSVRNSLFFNRVGLIVRRNNRLAAVIAVAIGIGFVLGLPLVAEIR